jgi:SAM-dependent methyltransferase
VTEIQTDVLIIGASLAGAAAAKRTVDAGFRTITIEKKELPRHKICSGILSPRGYAFLRENFGEPPDNAFHAPKWVTGVNFLFPNGLQLPMPFIPGPTPHIYRKHADHHVVKACREMARVLRPGGGVAILEFAVPEVPVIGPAYLWYMHRVLPRIGRAVSGSNEAYGYLSASIDAFAKPAELVKTLRQSGFVNVSTVRLTIGSVCLYVARKA